VTRSYRMPSFNIKPDDRVRLRHMLDAALEVQEYVGSSIPEDLNRDRKLVHSLVRLLEIIGEAAAQLSEELRANAPEIPWPIVIGMRNRLIHAYFSINLNVVWSTSTEDIPPLIKELQRLLGEG
jgi:uncharacterized protein with HEPN domain